MRKAMWVVAGAVVSGLVVVAQAQQPVAPAPSPGPAWAFHVIDGKLPPEPPGEKTVAGSTQKFAMERIEDLLNPPDWFPDAHPPAPSIVVKGHAGALACGSCHLMSGAGHPESSDMLGMTADYIAQQMADFRSGVRRDYARMNAIAKEVSDEEVKQAAAWFASLKPVRTGRVMEAAMVPQTFVGPGRMRFVMPGPLMEPIGTRIITVPENQTQARLRDPNTTFISYVPPGSIARGKVLAETGGGKSVACIICHGPNLKGLGNVPRLTGAHPIYVARQLMLFKDGTRNGVDGQLMKQAVARLTDGDIVDLAAFLGSLTP